MLFTGSGRHRRQSQAEKAAERAIAAAGVVGAGIALPLLTATGAHAAPSAVWDRVAECESGGNWSLDSGDGVYGGLQITAQRWVDYGGTQYAALPSDATRSQQIAVAERILATEGPQPWASCADPADLRTVSAPGVVDDNDSASEAGALRGARGAARANTAADGTVATPNAAPVFSGLPGYDPVYHVYWYQKNGGWFWTSHQSLYERYIQLTYPQPSTPAPSPTTAPDGQATPTAPVSPVAPTPPTDPGTTPSPSPTTPPGNQNGNGTGNGAENGNANGNGNGNSQDGNGGGNQSVAPSTPPTGPTGPAADPSPAATTPAPNSSTPPTSPSATTDTPATGTPASSAPAAQPYTVGPGDTLAKIARTQGLEGGWAELYKTNQQVVGGNPDLIQPGQVLNLG
ncbi:transglycosylase family protein [Kitasatospora sp. NPDC092948]|uniref:transglycosylase family protein n=1 Tax=Kitasatospora sp. NPDC092948 TaxID=3364088 RepID=UPI0037F2BF5B